MSILTSFLGPLLLLGLTISGLLLIVAPSKGQNLLKNLAVAAGLVLLGSLLVQVACSRG